ncbi:hypothetical protein, partial [Aeromonas veronii]|uniref:hypothetical protein n=1 Tax=Aeromonas veronii TaxID=654 RepID=UPI002247742E
MKSEQLERITNSSIKDVELLANLRSSMCENDFYLMAHQEFSKYIRNPKVVSMIINTSNNTYELSRLLQMKDRDWYSGAILYFCNIFREAMQSNKAAVISIVEGEYASIHASLENYHDSYFLQNQHMSDNPRHIVRAYFRMMGDTIESVHYPHIQFMYRSSYHLTPASNRCLVYA